MLSPHVLKILTLIAVHYTLTSAQIRRLLFGEKDRDGRQTRRLLADMLRRKLICKTHMEVVNPLHPVTASVYFPSKTGCEALAVSTGDFTWLATNCAQPQWQNLRHFLLLSDLRILIQTAVSTQSAIEMPCFFNEFDVLNPRAALNNPAERYRLYTVCTPPEEKHRVVCCPDAGFLLRKAGGGSRAYYVELETGANPFKSAAEKTPGYAMLAEKKLFSRHFPDAASFSVLVVAPNPGWRDGLRSCFATKERPDLYRFVAQTDLKPESFLFAPIVYSTDAGPFPLVKP